MQVNSDKREELTSKSSIKKLIDLKHFDKKKKTAGNTSIKVKNEK